MAVVQDIKHACLLAGAEDLIVNLKLHAKQKGDALIGDKMKKY